YHHQPQASRAAPASALADPARASQADVASKKPPLGMRPAVLIGWLIALAVACVAPVMTGVRSISVEDAIAAIGGATDTAEQAAAAARMPRTVMALLVGAALAMSGTTLQG